MSKPIKGISRKQLRRYVEMRERFDQNARVLASITSLLSGYRNLGDDRMEVDPVAFGHLHELLEHHVLNCWEVMDDFIYLPTAQLMLTQTQLDK